MSERVAVIKAKWLACAICWVALMSVFAVSWWVYGAQSANPVDGVALIALFWAISPSCLPTTSRTDVPAPLTARLIHPVRPLDTSFIACHSGFRFRWCSPSTDT